MSNNYTVKKPKNIKAIWLSQFDLNRLYCNETQRSVTEFTDLIRKLLQNVSDMNYNTVIVQARPNADSMYPSEFYPPSHYVVGKYGREFDYDPFAIIVREAHALGLAIHGWINPLRCMKCEELPCVDQRFTLRRWYDDESLNGRYLVSLDGFYYLDPAYPDVRRLIIEGARELANKYDLDGIHMDDYFYPTAAPSFDASSYADYLANGGILELADFRRSMLDLLVSGIYEAVKSVNPALPFGISPAGNIKNVYDRQFADVYRWCARPGYIDYICPQVYFGLEHQTCDFVSVCNIWQDAIKAEGIDLWIGMTLGKAKAKNDPYAGTGGNEWEEHRDILRRCLEYTRKLPKCVGVSYFCYQYYFDPVTGEDIESTREERNNFLPVLRDISWTE